MDKTEVLNKRLTEYFSDRREYIQALPPYVELRGENIRFKYPVDSSIPDDVIENPIIDDSKSQRKRAERKLKSVFSVLYDVHERNVQILGRYRMMNGRTQPVKVDAMLMGKVKRTCYVKQADWNRFFGLELYNMLSGNSQLDFIFGDSVFVDAKAPGRLKHYIIQEEKEIQEETEGKKEGLNENKKYVTNLIRLEVLADLLSLHDLAYLHNTNIDDSFNIHLFDFDHAFDVKSYKLYDGVTLVDNLPLGEIIRDEKNLITRRALKERKRIRKLIDIMKEVDHKSETARSMGKKFNNMGEYLEFMLNSYGNWENGES